MENSNSISLESLPMVLNLGVTPLKVQNLWKGYPSYAMPKMQETTAQLKNFYLQIPTFQPDEIDSLLKKFKQVKGVAAFSLKQLNNKKEEDQSELDNVIMEMFSHYLKTIERLEAAKEHYAMKEMHRHHQDKQRNRISKHL